MIKYVIVCIDYDNKFLNKLKKVILSFLNDDFIVATFTTAEMALTKCEEYLEKDYELVFTISSLNLPKMKGDEFISEVTSLNEKCKHMLFIDGAPANKISEVMNKKSVYKLLTRELILNDINLIVEEIINNYNSHKELLETNYYLNKQIKRHIKILDTKELELDLLTKIDILTNMHNRRGFFYEAEKLLLEAKKSVPAFSIILFEIRDFKEINELYGRSNGNKFIQCIASSIFKLLTFNEVFARVDSKIFALALPLNSFKEAKEVLDTLLFSLNKQPITLNDTSIKMTFNTSIASLDERNEDIGSIFDRAMLSFSKTVN